MILSNEIDLLKNKITDYETKDALNNKTKLQLIGKNDILIKNIEQLENTKSDLTRKIESLVDYSRDLESKLQLTNLVNQKNPPLHDENMQYEPAEIISAKPTKLKQKKNNNGKMDKKQISDKQIKQLKQYKTVVISKLTYILNKLDENKKEDLISLPYENFITKIVSYF